MVKRSDFLVFVFVVLKSTEIYLHQGVSHNGSTPQDLTELLVIRGFPDY